MDIKDIQHLAIERIYLVPDASEGQLGYVWCDNPAPGEGMDASEAVEYVRKDVHEAIIKRQAIAAKAGMDAAKKHGSHMESEAKRLHAECNPEALESEREANAKLTELVAELEAHVERLDNELQEKALTDDGVLADAYWNCADKITPWLGEKTGPDTLINSVAQSLEFLIEQWREKKIIEQERDAYRTAEEHQIALRQKLEQERDSLAALFVRLQDGATDLIHASSEEEAGDAMELIAECSEKEARNILARRDALKQAEALERLRLLLQETQFDKAPSVARVVMQVKDAINRVKQEVRPLRLVASDHSDPHPNCELECGAYGTYCKCNAEAQQ